MEASASECSHKLHDNESKEPSSRYVFKRDLLTQTEKPKEVTTYFFWFFTKIIAECAQLITL